VIDTKEATKRLEEIQKITDKAEIKFKFYPNIASTPIKILNQLAAQGIETMSSRVKGGVMPDGTVFVIVEKPQQHAGSGEDAGARVDWSLQL
jgi:hypothetical protein